MFDGKRVLREKKSSRAWFRSTDLWVMGPARFHCATLLTVDCAKLERKKESYLVIKVLDEVHEVVVDGLVVGVDDPVQVREVPIQVDVVCIGTAGQKVLASLKVEF